jgi:hypothetical protein
MSRPARSSSAGKLHPLLGKEDLDDIAAAVRKVVTAFRKKAANIPIDYATEIAAAIKMSTLEPNFKGISPIRESRLLPFRCEQIRG